MAVPSAVQNRIKQETAALQAAGIDPNGPPPGFPGSAPVAAPTPPVAPPAPTPTPIPIAAPSGDDAATRARLAEIEQELSTTRGRVSATATENEELKRRFELISSNRTFLESSVADLSSKNQELERQLAELKANGTKSQVQSIVSALDESGPTEKQMEDYGDSKDFVERIVRQQLAVVLKPMVAQLSQMESALAGVKDISVKIPKLEASVQTADINTARSREEQFLRAEVLPYFPDFETVRNSSEWKAYLAKDTGRGYTNGVLLKTYREQGSATGIRSVLGAYYEQRKSSPSLDALAVPAKTTADVPTPAPAPKMKASEYKANLRALTMKRLSKADWDAYRARWEEALNAGNVEMDTELR